MDRNLKASTYFAAGFHASRLVKPGHEEEKTMNATCGQKSFGLSSNASPLGSVVKTLLESPKWHSKTCAVTWKVKVMKSSRYILALQPSEQSNPENGFGFWPTVTRGAPLCGGTGNFNKLHKMRELGVITEEERRNLSQGNGGKSNPALMEFLMGFPKGHSATTL